MFKHAHVFAIIFLLSSILFGSWLILYSAEPEWVQYNERVVGENHPTLTDVVNRPDKQIWGNFTSQHTVNGAHKGMLLTQITASSEPDIDTDSAVIWYDDYTLTYYLLVDFGGVQVKVELL